MEKELAKEIIEENKGPVKWLKPVSGGASHHVFDVKLADGNQFIFQGVGTRWHDLPSFESGYRIEPSVLRFLENKEYSSPALVSYNFSKNKFDDRYLFIEKIPGSDMNEIKSKDNFLDLVAQSGSQLRDLQELKSFNYAGKLYEDEGELSVHSFEWKEMYKSLIHTYTTHMIDRRYDHLRLDIENLVEDHQDFLESERFTLVHQEFGPRNIIVEKDQVTGIVDWERTISGDPKFDHVSTRERMIQKARQLNIDNPRERIEKALEEGYGKKIFEEIEPEKDDLYRLAYIAQLMWVARDEDPEKLQLEKQFEEIKERLTRS